MSTLSEESEPYYPEFYDPSPDEVCELMDWLDRQGGHGPDEAPTLDFELTGDPFEPDPEEWAWLVDENRDGPDEMDRKS